MAVCGMPHKDGAKYGTCSLQANHVDRGVDHTVYRDGRRISSWPVLDNPPIYALLIEYQSGRKVVMFQTSDESHVNTMFDILKMARGRADSEDGVKDVHKLVVEEPRWTHCVV